MRAQLLFSFLFVILFSATRAQIYDTLPVIVHVIHNGEAIGTGRNISQAQVHSQFDVLNEDFRAQNADLANVPAAFAPFIGDLGLNFAKALADPNGNPLAEPGIERINRNSMGWSGAPYTNSYIDNTIKPQTIWDPTQYLNIWVLDMGSNGLTVYNTLPSCAALCQNVPASPDTSRDGIVVHFKAFGRTGNVAAPYHKGRAATHSIAQWLGLRRLAQTTLAGGCADDCVADTPVDDYFNIFGCPAFPHVTSCSANANGAMFMNFLSYVDDSCMIMFTQGQKTRVDSVLGCGFFQSALRQSQVPVTVKEEPGVMVLSFYPNPSQGEITLNVPGNAAGILEVYSTLGQKVFEAKASSSQIISLPPSLGNGAYLLKLRTEKINYTTRLMLAR